MNDCANSVTPDWLLGLLLTMLSLGLLLAVLVTAYVFRKHL
jgi:hypothetical protein